MNTHAGYSKKTLDNTNVLLAGGGDKSLADFIGGIQYVSASQKILYRAADTNTWTDLVTLVTTDEKVRQVHDDTSTSWTSVLIVGTNTSVPTSVRYAGGIYILPSTGGVTAMGEAYFESRAHFNSYADFNYIVNFNDIANFNETVYFDDDTNYSGTARFYNDIDMGTSQSPVSIDHYGTYNHYGLSYHDGNINMNYNDILDVGGIHGSSSISMGDASFSSLNVSGTTTLRDRLQVYGAIDGGSNSFIIGDITASGTVRTNGDLITHNVKPLTTDTYNIGNSSKYYKSLYANNIFSKFISTNDNYILKPLGGDYRSDSSLTGAICITLPLDIGYGTISMWIDVATTYSSFSVYVSGYANDSLHNAWDSGGAVVYGAHHTVYLGKSNNGLRVYIGQTSDVWDNPNISIRDVTIGTNSDFGYLKGQWSITFEQSMSNIDSSSTIYAVLNTDLSSYLTSQDHYRTTPGAGTAGTSYATSGSTISIPYITVNAYGHVTAKGTHTHTVTGFLTSQDHYKTSITAGTVGTSSATSGSTLDVPYVTFNANGHVTGYGTHTHTITGFISGVWSDLWAQNYHFGINGLIIEQTTEEISGIQLNGDYINMWAACDDYCIRFWDEDNGTEVWNITNGGVFSGYIDWTHVNNTPDFTYAHLWGATLTTDLNSTSMNRNRLYYHSGTASNRPNSDSYFGTVLQISNVDNPSNGTNNHWVSQLDFVHDGSLYYRSRINTNSWDSWAKVLTSANYTDYISNSYPLSIATTTDSSSITLAANTKYKLTAGGSTYVFTTPTSGTSGNYLPLDGGTMTGAGSIVFNSFETNSKRWFYGGSRNAGWKYDYGGNEALIISAGSYSTAAISFYSGSRLTLNDSSNQWSGTTADMQIKQNCVGIGANVNTSYKLYVAGSTAASGGFVHTSVADDGYVLLAGGGYKALADSKPFGEVVWIGTDGVMETGHYIDWHYDNTTGSDYSCRLQVQGNNSNVINLPTGSGTLALTSDIPSGGGGSISISNYSSTFYPCGYTSYSGSNITALKAYSGFYVTSSGAYHTSDIRKKCDIQDIYDDEITKLFNTHHGYIHSFRWKDTDKPAFGFIAQELLEYCPEAVDYNIDTGFYTVNYEMALSKVVGVLFKKIKKQDSEIKKLRKLLENRK